MLADVLEQWGCVEVSAMDIYSEIFHLGEGLIQRSDEPPGEFKANPLVYWKNDDEDHGHYRILFEDTFHETIKEAQQADFTLVNGLTYFGRKNVQEHASKMYAMILDLDGVDDDNMEAFLSGAVNGQAYPVPNFFAISGAEGLHLYYLFDQPISLFPNIKLQLKELKFALIKQIWNQNTSNDKKVQFQGINQGFKVVGGKSKAKYGKVPVRGFRFNTHPFSLSELCSYVEPEHRVDESKLFKESKYSKEQCKEKFPQWYEKVIVNGDKSKTKWDIKGKVNGDDPYALYNWWLRKLRYASYGHRYFGIMALAIYAVKNDVPYNRLVEDAYSLLPFLNSLNPKEPFTETDIKSALECYDNRYYTFPRDDLSRLTAIEIKPNLRNGRSRMEHLHADVWIGTNGRPATNVCKGNRELALKHMREEKEIPGRPTKQQVVVEWKQQNPNGTKADCIKQTGLSKPTVYRWW